MKTKRLFHDPTKPNEAEMLLYSALDLMVHERYAEALENIFKARKLLWDYLHPDNVIEDNEV